MMRNNCDNCSNCHDGRCARYNDSLSKFVYKFCKGKHYIDKNEAISLWRLEKYCKDLKINKW